MHLALLTPAFLLFPSCYETLFAPSVPFQISLFCLSAPPHTHSHTHSLSLLSPSVPPSLPLLLIRSAFLFSLPPSFPPPLPHTLQIGFGTRVLWSVNTHTRSEQWCHCRGDVSGRGLIQSDTCSLPSFPIAMEAITLLLKGLLSECVCVFPSSKGWQGGTSAAGHLIGWIERYGRVSWSILSPSCLNSSFTWTLHPLRSVCLPACLPAAVLLSWLLRVDGFPACDHPCRTAQPPCECVCLISGECKIIDGSC